jgi:hypothetical protein
MLIILVVLNFGLEGKGKNLSRMNTGRGKLINKGNKKVPLSGCDDKTDAADCLAAYSAAEEAFTAATDETKIAMKPNALPDDPDSLITAFKTKCAARACETNCAALLDKLEDEDPVPVAADYNEFAEACKVEADAGGNDNDDGDEDKGNGDDGRLTTKFSRFIFFIILSIMGFYFKL